MLRISPESLRLGFGCSGAWGMNWFSRRKAIGLIHQAVDLGVRCFDTSTHYCGGEAERRLGAALKDISSDDIFISTKTGTGADRRGRTYKDFSEAAIREDVETSLKRLDRERLDLLYLHGPSTRQIDDTRAVLSRLKEEGKIAAIGVCGAGTELEHAVNEGAADVIMGVYNLFQRAHGPVFALAAQKGVGVVAIAPLAQGLYRKDLFLPRSIADLWTVARAIVNKQDTLSRARGQAAQALHEMSGLTAAQAALGFTLANSHIDMAITTTTRPRHLADSAAIADQALTQDQKAHLETLADALALDRNTPDA